MIPIPARNLPKLACALLLASFARAEDLSFNRDIRPILSENCFLCHGTDPEHRGGELRLDLREEAIAPRENGPAIVPGNAEKSALFHRITTNDLDDIMPPPEAHLPNLKPEHIETLKTWINQGAVYQAHWAFVPPKKAAFPIAAEKNPVDSFVRARLKKEGFTPTPEASPEILVRRLYLDLTGLPPTPAEKSAFLADKNPARWENLVTKLMESPHFAERLAMPWLDAARYSDTHGYSIDDHRDMWAWRDWVINSFLENQPYDQFLVEQVAGDLIPNATPDQIAATGFLRNGMNTHEGGIIEEEYRVAQVIDKVDTVATSMLGLTVKCAQCHDHKYDPITHKDYYRFFAFFNESSEPGIGGTNGSTPPIMDYTSPLADGGMAGIKARIAELEYLRLHPSDEIVKARDSWEEGLKSLPRNSDHAATFPWGPIDSSAMKWIWNGQPRSRETINIRKNFSIVGKVEEAWMLQTCDDNSKAVLNGQPAGKVTVWTTPALENITKLIKEGDNSLEITASNIGGAGGFIAILAIRTEAGWQFFPSDATWQTRKNANDPWLAATQLAELGAAPWHDVTAAVNMPAGINTPAVVNLVAVPPAKRTEAQWKALTAAFAKSEHPLAKRAAEILKILDLEIAVLQKDLTRGHTTVMVMDHKPGIRQTHLLERGAYDQPAKEVLKPGGLSALPELKSEGDATRLDLAKWIIAPENPLTARVAVNRTWQMIFGRGIVETVGDFGNQGSWPTHPELLDWLAVDFVEHDWNLRQLIRTIVTSKTYRQSAVISSLALEKDPRNEFLARSPRPRLAAEIIRDKALKTSGLLNESIGGPSVHPDQPELWSEISHFGNPAPFTAQIYLPGRGASQHRRSIYTFWKRTSPPPEMTLFDAPTRETCSVVRGSTNTPLQALVLMNDPQYIEASLAFAHRMIAEGGESPTDRVNYGFQLATGRMATSEEKILLEKSFQKHLARYAAEPTAAEEFVGEKSPELAAFTMLASIMLNLDETISRP